MPLPAFDPSLYHGIIRLLDTDATTVIATLRDFSTDVNYITSGSFELLRQGGCGGGKFEVALPFTNTALRVGKWIECYISGAGRVYLGRIENVDSSSPRGHSVSTYGPTVLLNDRAIGGFNANDNRDPHLFARDQNYFANDPDFASQEFTEVLTYESLVNEIYTRYIQPLGIGLQAIEEPIPQVPFQSAVFRGQESINQVIRNLALACHNASWGINAQLQFFFLRNEPTVAATYQENVDFEVGTFKRSEDRSLIANRVYIVGDYVYGGDSPGPYFRYQNVFYDSTSWTLNGEKRLEAYLPWIRTHNEAIKWKNAFFAKYANAIIRYAGSTPPTILIPLPWNGYFDIMSEENVLLSRDVVETVSVDITNYPRLSFQTGPENHQHMEPPEPERWELGELGDLGEITSLLFDLTESANSSGHASSQEVLSSGQILSSGQLLSSNDPGSSGAPSSGAPSSGDSGNLSSGEVASSGVPLSSGELASSGVPLSSDDLLSSGGLASSDAPLSSNDSGAGSQPGSEKDTAIVPASWTSKGYTALFVAECPDVRFDDVQTVTLHGTIAEIPIDPHFLEVCEPNSIQVCGCQPNWPLTVGAETRGHTVLIRCASDPTPLGGLRIVLRLTGIRKGYRGTRFPERSERQYLANEAFINSAYPAE